MIEFKTNFRQIAEAWKKKPEKFIQAMNKGLQEGLRQYETRFIKEQLSGRKSSSYGLKKQSGILSNSVNLIMRREGQDLVGKITTGRQAWYAKVHQHENFAGYIKPKNKQWLTIPAIPGAVGRRASDFDLVFIKPIGKNPVLVGKGADAKRGVVFSLRRQVFIPKRLYFYEEFRTYGHRFIQDRIMSNLERAANAN